MGNHTQEHIKLCPYNLDYKQTTLRFGYYLLFRMPISKRRRLRILNLSVKTRLSTDKSSFYSTCPENATFPRTKCLNAVFTPRVQSAHIRRGRRTSVHGLWRQFPRLWHNRGLRHRYRNSYSPRHQACRAGWTGARWCGS